MRPGRNIVGLEDYDARRRLDVNTRTFDAKIISAAESLFGINLASKRGGHDAGKKSAVAGVKQKPRNCLRAGNQYTSAVKLPLPTASSVPLCFLSCPLIIILFTPLFETRAPFSTKWEISHTPRSSVRAIPQFKCPIHELLIASKMAFMLTNHYFRWLVP